MKKSFLITAFAVLISCGAFAQNFNAGLNVGLPMGDVSDFTTLNIGVDVNYLWEVSDQFEAGVTAGYSHFFGDSYDETFLGQTISIDIEDVSFLPIGAAVRYNVSEEFTIGADIGYAVGISPNGSDGGLFYAPKLQYGVSEALDIVLAYRGVSIEGYTFSSINLGVEFGL
ncbi:MAG: outer membrane beta-barrel protein [Lacinutrix sp.]|uniref:outer membrane beta-barrel protein n=1 Tax=Lacinutrix sp. TaxID=1937692 RepID=UPI0030B6DF66